VFNTGAGIETFHSTEPNSVRAYPIKCSGITDKNIKKLLAEILQPTTFQDPTSMKIFYTALERYSSKIDKKPSECSSYRTQSLGNCAAKSIIEWMHNELRLINNGTTYWKFRNFSTEGILDKASQVVLKNPDGISYTSPAYGLKFENPTLDNAFLKKLIDYGNQVLERRKTRHPEQPTFTLSDGPDFLSERVSCGSERELN
jgi:hypothetical protein